MRLPAEAAELRSRLARRKFHPTVATQGTSTGSECDCDEKEELQNGFRGGVGGGGGVGGDVAFFFPKSVRC